MFEIAAGIARSLRQNAYRGRSATLGAEIENLSRDASGAKTGNVRSDAIEEVKKRSIVTSHCHRVVKHGTAGSNGGS